MKVKLKPMIRASGRLRFSFASYGHTPDKNCPNYGHDGEVGPGIAGVGGGKECTGGDQAGEDEM
jgi:hypothetical protein